MCSGNPSVVSPGLKPKRRTDAISRSCMEGKRSLGRPRRRWIDNIKMDLLEIGVSVVDWIGLAQDRYRWRACVNSVMNLLVP
jgi:hypothetical protein